MGQEPHPRGARMMESRLFMKERGMMSQPQRSSQLPLIGTILLCLLLIGVILMAYKRLAKKSEDPSSKIIQHTVETSPEEALKYWTAEKKRKAKPARMPHVEAPEQGKE